MWNNVAHLFGSFQLLSVNLKRQLKRRKTSSFHVLTFPTITNKKINKNRIGENSTVKISCLRTDLVTAVSNVSRAVSSKATIPALEGVLIKAYGEKLNISGYNLEIGITTDVDATIQQEGEIVLPSVSRYCPPAARGNSVHRNRRQNGDLHNLRTG